MLRRIGALIVAAGALFGVALLTAQGRSGEIARGITFNRDIAPIIWQNCATCHREGQLGPFSLVTYEDVRPRAAEVARAVNSRRMPPWKPVAGHGEFLGTRRLSDEQIALIDRWVRDGSNRGDPADLPTPPSWARGWQLGQPDLVITMPQAYQLPGKGRDVFRTFVVRIPLDAPRLVRAMEFNPGNFKAVHHANIKIDQTRLSRDWDERDPGPGYEGGGSREAKFPDGQFLGWTPGQSPRVALPGMSWHVEPGSDLVIEMHMMPTGVPESVQASVGLFFTTEPPSRTPYMLRLGRQDIDIAPGRRDYVNEDAYKLPVDVDLLALQPHAHYLAREIRASATLPDGTTKELIYINDWDFHWQDLYALARPLTLPKGSVIAMRYTYDNSSSNPRNPNRPPQRVTFGQTSASEMGSLWVQVLPHSAGDLQTLDRDFSPKVLADDIAGDEKWLEMNTRDARLRAELAAGYLDAGRVDDALTQLREAVKLDPSHLRHYDVGRVLLVARRFTEAEATFRRALELKPDFVEGLYGLGVAFDGQGKLSEAENVYTRALQLNLDFADAHFNLARVLTTEGKFADAIAHYKEVLRLRPDDGEAKSALQKLGPQQ
jgi:tetratricopeptide (TPR) repeat protein/mono/diheme cytochrome c family protein